MLILASRSATVLVIFVIAIVAFCLASVFGAMTGPISILPDESESSGGILDNLSAITEGTGDTGNSYGYQDYDKDYSSSDDDSSSSDVETTVDDSSQKTPEKSDSGSSKSSGSNYGTSVDSGSSSGSSSGSGSSEIETTVDE